MKRIQARRFEEVPENMAKDKPDPIDNNGKSCIFCLIASDQDVGTEVIKKTKELVCFRDIDPGAPHHYLVVPRQHIVNCFSLHRGHMDLVERMADMGKAVLQEQGVDMTDISLGFHKPPYISVDHLHLHVLAPASQIYKHKLYKFIPRTKSFVTKERFQKYLKDQSSPAKNMCSQI